MQTILKTSEMVCKVEWNGFYLPGWLPRVIVVEGTTALGWLAMLGTLDLAFATIMKKAQETLVVRLSKKEHHFQLTWVILADC